MWKRLLALSLLIPLLDSLFLVFVATQLLSWQLTVALVVLTALVGMLLVRAEGRHTVGKIQTDLARGEVPTNSLVDGGLLIAAGAFLLTPGLLTDTIGFLLVLPPSRYVFRTVVKKWVLTPYLDKKTGGFATGNVYTFGFPNPGDASSDGGWRGPGGAGGSGGGSSSASGQSNDDTVRMDDDAYDIDFEDDGEEKGNP